MLLSLSQAAVPTARNCSINLKLSSSNPPLTSDSHKKSKFIVKTIHPRRRALSLTLAKADGSVDSNNSAAATSNLTSRSFQDETVSVGQGNVPLEGVIQFEKPDFSSRINKWGRVALLAGGDVLALLLFSAIGRFNHGFSVFDFDTLRTADPFIAGWFLSAYFLGGYADDGRGMNGLSKAVVAATKSWAAGVPVSLTPLTNPPLHTPPPLPPTQNFGLLSMSWCVHTSICICATRVNYKGSNIWPSSTIYLHLSNNGNHCCLTHWMESIIVQLSSR
ncbi:hypothetical protein CISIN_1g023715mg [Citrus sinensis]|uniref:Uncharacterized protein n=1 Tax=Citrus sinensis TaxID=2711 RepID=A0A067H142_CITSI|nr:hypothetical protein CISIN_1g023715mg [Citrus sinensis]KDO81452.1 hypothetical protein CISIN_1g023715mg [Citrus sinensis]